jgi:hypothetical protein
MKDAIVNLRKSNVPGFAPDPYAIFAKIGMAPKDAADIII